MIENVAEKDLFENLNVYQFDSCRDFLKFTIDSLGRYQKGNGLTQLAKSLGYKSPSTLSMILSGERLPTKRILESIQSHFQLNDDQFNYLCLLLEKEKLHQKGLDNYEALQKIGHYRDSANVEMLDLEAFESISRWYYLAIKNLIPMTSDHSNQNIAKLLKFRVKPHQIQEALDALIRQNLIEKNGDNYKVISKPFRTKSNVTSYAVRKFHDGMINEALYALNNENTDQRYVSGLTLKVSKDKKEQALEDIKQFLEHFNDKYYDEDGDSLGQLNVQYFSLNDDSDKVILQ